MHLTIAVLCPFQIPPACGGELVQGQPIDHLTQRLLDLFATLRGPLQPNVGVDQIGRIVTEHGGQQQPPRSFSSSVGTSECYAPRPAWSIVHGSSVQRVRIARRASGALDLQRRPDEQELVGLVGNQLAEIEILDVPDPAPGTASTAQVSAPVRMMSRSARYSQAEMPKPGSPALNWSTRSAFQSG
jgi:hypothetical protein